MGSVSWTAEQMIEAVIHELELMHYVAQVHMNALTSADAEWDGWVQVEKDMRKYIAQQNHTLNLLRNGLL